MKEESVLNVLMYLFQHHMSDSCELRGDENDLIQELASAGFESGAIQKAFSWLEELIKDHTTSLEAPQTHTLRIYTTKEMDTLDLTCRRFILVLEQQGILTPETRELVINQALLLTTEEIDLSLIQWITLMVLMHHTDNDEALACMEFLVLDNSMGGIH